MLARDAENSECEHLDLPATARTRIWEQSSVHFDDFLHSLMALIEVSTLEGWVDVLYRACDILGENQGRCRNANL